MKIKHIATNNEAWALTIYQGLRMLMVQGVSEETIKEDLTNTMRSLLIGKPPLKPSG